MSENGNKNIIIENTRDIQNIKDAMIFQSVINKNVRSSQLLMGIGGIILSGVMYFVLCAVGELQKEMKTIEGVEKKKDDTEE